MQTICRSNGISPPTFTTSLSGGKGAKRAFFSKVVVDNQHFGTYPKDYSTEEDAENAAAKLALDYLATKKNSSDEPTKTVTTYVRYSSSSEDSSDTSEVTDLETVVDRIIGLIGKRANGVWSTRIAAEYSEKFGVALPRNWEAQLKKVTDPRFRIDSPMKDRYVTN